MVNDNNPILKQYFISSESVLFSEYDRSKNQNSSTNLGSNRERFHNLFLEKVLPHKLKVTNGEIWDSKGAKTGQLDTILVKDDVPSLDFGGSNTYFAEGVFSVIEVKSNLTRAKMSESIQSLAPIQQMYVHNEGLSILGRAPDAILDRPLCIIFAYEGATWKTLINEINEKDAHSVVDLVCILRNGILVRDGLFWKSEDANTKFYLFDGKGSSLGIMYFLLSYFLSDYIARNISLRPYFEPFENWNDNGQFKSYAKSK